MLEELLHFTTTIVSSYTAKNEIEPDGLQALIRDTYKTLGDIADPPKAVEEPEPPAPAVNETPAVPVKKSVFPDHLVCLCCGKSATMLKRHLMTAHGLTVDQYRAKWGLPLSYPMLAPNYSERRSEIAKETGLGRVR